MMPVTTMLMMMMLMVMMMEMVMDTWSDTNERSDTWSAQPKSGKTRQNTCEVMFACEIMSACEVMEKQKKQGRACLVRV